MLTLLKRIHLPGLAAVATTLGALAASPALLNLLPSKLALVIAGISSIAQAFTKPVPKDPKTTP